MIKVSENQPKSLKVVGVEYGLTSGEVHIVAVSVGIWPARVSQTVSVLTHEQIEQLRPALERTRDMLRRKPAVAVA